MTAKRRSSQRIVIWGDKARGYHWQLTGRNGSHLAVGNKTYRSIASAERAIVTTTEAMHDADIEIQDWDRDG